MTIFGNMNAVRIPNLYLNRADDPAPGQVLASPSGSIVQAYAGQVGLPIVLSNDEALRLSDTTVGILLGGGYQYVKFKAGSAASNVRGQIAFWDDTTAFQVTPDSTTAALGKVAGIILNAVTKGNYGWIQIGGVASVKAKAALTKAAATVDGDLAMVDAANSATFDVLADATQITSPTLKLKLGICAEIIAQGAVGKVLLDPRGLY
jgi:hypothetical protein